MNDDNDRDKIGSRKNTEGLSMGGYALSSLIKDNVIAKAPNNEKRDVSIPQGHSALRGVVVRNVTLL